MEGDIANSSFASGNPVFFIFSLLAAASVLCFALPGAALSADLPLNEQQIQELRSAVETLKAELEPLKNQAAQSDVSVKLNDLQNSINDLKNAPVQQPLGARIGGHLKFYAFDKSQGDRNGTDQRNNSSAGLSSFHLFVDKDISEKVSVSVYPEISVRAGATPSLGSDITRSTSASTSIGISEAFIKTVLPKNFELRVGVFYPVFSEEYASHIWWDEQYNANKGVNDLQSWTDSGIEVFRNFDFADWTLAAHGYLLNGGGAMVDNNEGKSVLLHLSPEISNLKLMGAIGAGKWDVSNRYDALRYAYGSEWKHGKLTLRGEYLYNKYNGTTVGAKKEDTVKKGYYFKGLYRLSPKWRALAVFSNVSLPCTTGATLRKDRYLASTLGLNFFITDSSVVIGEVTFVDAERSDESQKLEHSRLTIGIRSTF